MPTGIYSAYTGASAELEALEVIANNIANASTPGFLRDRTRFDALLAASIPFARVEPGHVDFAPGARETTGSPLHAAIEGEGFFAVQSPDGRERYTRRGDFRLDGQNRLVLPDGTPVLGDGGPLVVPPGARAALRDDGTLLVDGRPAGRLRVVRFADPSVLAKHGASLLEAPPGVAPEPIDPPRLVVGAVEGSNVNLAAELAALIEATRAFEAAVRSMQLSDEMTQQLVQAQP